MIMTAIISTITICWNEKWERKRTWKFTPNGVVWAQLGKLLVDGVECDPRGQMNMRAPLDWTSSSWLISNAAQRYCHYQSILMIVSPPLSSMLVNSKEGICASDRCFAAVCVGRCESGAKDLSRHATGGRWWILCRGALMNFANSASTINSVGWSIIFCKFIFLIFSCKCQCASRWEVHDIQRKTKYEPSWSNRPLGLGGTASWNSCRFHIDPSLLQRHFLKLQHRRNVLVVESMSMKIRVRSDYLYRRCGTMVSLRGSKSSEAIIYSPCNLTLRAVWESVRLYCRGRVQRLLLPPLLPGNNSASSNDNNVHCVYRCHLTARRFLSFFQQNILFTTEIFKEQSCVPTVSCRIPELLHVVMNQMYPAFKTTPVFSWKHNGTHDL